MRDAADDVGPELDRLAHQRRAAVEGKDALLRERHELQVDQAADFLAQVGESAQRGELRIAHVDMAAHVLDAAGQLPAQHLAYPAPDIVVGQVGDPLGPDRDALEQRAGDIRPGLPDRQHRVEVDVRLDQRRRDETSAQVNGLRRGGARVHGREHAARDPEIGQCLGTGQPGIAQDQVDHPPIIPRRQCPRPSALSFAARFCRRGN